MGAIALSRTLQGGLEGLDRGMARRDRETQRERSDVQFEQGQEEREYQLTRRSIEDTRSDEKYQRKMDTRERNNDVNRAMNAVMRGDLGPANEVLNKYSEDDLSFDLQKNEKGTYTSVMGYKDKKSESKEVSIDDIGKVLIGFKSDDNPFVRQAAQKKIERDVKAKKGERKHDIALIRAKGEETRKANAAKDGGSKSGPAAEKSKLAVSKGISNISRNLYGTMFGDQWSFNKDQDKSLYLNLSSLGEANYYTSDNPNINDAANSAYQKMREFLATAETDVNVAIDEGRIDEKDKDNAVVDRIDELVGDEIKSMAPTPGQTLQRGQPEKADRAGSANDIEAIRRYKSMSPEEQENARPYLEKHLKLGPGELDKMLSSSLGNDQGEPVKAGVSGEGGPSLVREASAGEAQPATTAPEEEQPKLTRQQRRKEGVKSQKAHKKIAVSEYKNEWVNMDDNEKVEWWTDNASALKAASPRSHKKANKEIIAIRNKSKIGRPGRASK